MSISPAGLSPHGLKKKKSTAVALPPWVGDLGLIRLAGACFALALTLSVGLIGVSAWYLQRQSARLVQAQQLRGVAFDQLSHVENEKLEIRSYQPQFIELRNKGLIGEENRLEWIDAIRHIQEGRKLLPITYEIDAQQGVRLEARMPLGDYRLRASRMSLHMDLLHEMDLFNFLDDLKRRSYYALQDCSLKRTSAVQNGAIAPTLAADCTLYWLTLGAAAVAPAGAAK